jgi:hypothetical protein
MAKTSKKSSGKLSFFDFNAWNFIIFLLLGFVLIVTVAIALQGPMKNLSVRAGIQCPEITQLPNPEDCPGAKWVYGRTTGMCPTFSCPTRP